MKNVKVFEVAEDEWIAAETADEAAAFYKTLVSQATYEEVLQEFGEPVELTPEQLSRLKFTDDEVQPPRRMTFAERLAEICAADPRLPQFFATGNL